LLFCEQVRVVRSSAVWSAATVISVLLCTASLAWAHSSSGRGDGATCSIGDLPGLSAQYARVRQPAERGVSSETLTPGAAADFWAVASSVLRVGSKQRTSDPSGHTPGDGVGLPSLSALPCDRAVRARDRIAWSMSMVGYSAREIADVIEGHLTRAVIDQAYARAMAGEPRHKVAAFLEAKWRESPRASTVTAALAPPRCAGGSSGARIPIEDLTGAISELAEEHRVAPALVRAVIAAESSGRPCAVSRAGAIGLMQLMPATAAALGVDPWNPLDNLRGGVAYLGSMLRQFGEDVRLALIAYNAGPQHAARVKSGRAVAYRETRQYLDAITARYPLR
jgi:soluble lytic murein transglycosylase-like protein